MTKRIYPRSGQTYTLRQVIETLELRDNPCLSFSMGGTQVIQDSHLTHEQLLDVPGFAETLWRFAHETNEWIPIFRYADDRPITDFVDTEPYIDPFAERQGVLHVTPKGHPSPQYYRIDGDEIVGVNDPTNRYPIPTFDDHGKSPLAYNPGYCDFCKCDVAERVNYRDPDEGSSGPLYEVCRPCRDRRNEEVY